jgi:hypothetical protein
MNTAQPSILRLLAKERSSQQIGETLSIEKRTAEVYIQLITAKLRAVNHARGSPWDPPRFLNYVSSPLLTVLRDARSCHLLIIDRASSSAFSRGPLTILLGLSMSAG